MKKYRATIKIGLMFLLLILISLSPVIITKIKNNQIIDELYVDKLESRENTDMKNNLSTAKKIEIIKNAKIKRNVAMLSEKELNDNIKNDKIKKIIKELKNIQNKGLFPSVNLNEIYSVEYLNSYTFFDIENPKLFVNILEVSIKYSNFKICLSMEFFTNKIYQVTLYSDIELSKSTKKINPKNYFIDYLGLPKQGVEYKGNENGGFCIYNDGNIDFAYKYSNDKYYFQFRL